MDILLGDISLNRVRVVSSLVDMGRQKDYPAGCIFMACFTPYPGSDRVFFTRNGG